MMIVRNAIALRGKLLAYRPVNTRLPRSLFLETRGTRLTESLSRRPRHIDITYYCDRWRSQHNILFQ